MERAKMMDWAWKGFTVLLSLIVVPSVSWIWDSEMRLGALEYKMDDANKSLEKIVNHIEGESGQSAIDREVEMKLLEQRVKNLENKSSTLQRDVSRLKSRR
jgi:hypothetical protein